MNPDNRDNTTQENQKSDHLSKGEKDLFPRNNNKRLRIFNVLAIVLVAGIILPAIAFFYNITAQTHENKNIVILPDDTKVEMDTQTWISYRPIWWGISPVLSLKGKANIIQKEAEKIIVEYKNIKIYALGADFIVEAYDDTMLVSCFKGTIRVTYGKDGDIDLIPGMEAKIDDERLVYKTF